MCMISRLFLIFASKCPKVEKNGNVITATFSLEAGKQEVKLKEIQLFAFLQICG